MLISKFAWVGGHVVGWMVGMVMSGWFSLSCVYLTFIWMVGCIFPNSPNKYVTDEMQQGELLVAVVILIWLLVHGTCYIVFTCYNSYLFFYFSRWIAWHSIHSMSGLWQQDQLTKQSSCLICVKLAQLCTLLTVISKSYLFTFDYLLRASYSENNVQCL